MKKKVFSEIMYWTHVLIFAFIVIPFFIPLSLWHSRPVFHFWYVLIIVGIEIITGLVMYSVMKRIRIVCPLTTWMQTLRGFKVHDKKNWDHSFVREFFERLGLKLPYGASGAINFISLLLVIIIYINNIK